LNLNKYNMGAYENPTILRDTSLGVYSKAIDAVGKTIAGAMISKEKARQERVANAKKERLRVQGIQFKIQTDKWKNANKNIAEYKKGGGDLYKEYQNNVTWLLNGKGVPGMEGYELGAIDAATQLATQDNLSEEQKTYLNAVLQRADKYQTNALLGAGNVIADLEDFEGVTAVMLNKTHYWAGANAYEQDRAMLTTYGLQGDTLEGLTSKKESIVGENGEGILKVTSKVDKDSDLFGKLSKKTQEELEKKNYEIEWKVDPSEWKEGLIREITPTLDIDTVTEKAQILDGEDLKDDYYIGKPGTSKTINVRTFVGDGKENNIQYEFVDTEKILENKVINDTIQATASKLVGVGDKGEGDLKAAMQNTLLMGDGKWNIEATNDEGEKIIVNNFSEFRDLSSGEQERILEEELKEQYLEDAMDASAAKFGDLDPKLQEYLIDSRGGEKPSKDEIFYYNRSKDDPKNISEETDFSYQDETIERIDALKDLQPGAEHGAGGENDTYEPNQAKVHKRFLESHPYNLNVKLGQDAYDYNKKVLKEEKDNGDLTEEQYNEQLKTLSKEGLFVLVGKTYKRQTGYNSYKNNTLSSIIGKHVPGYKSVSANRNWQNKVYANKKRKNLPN
jgi:hypothetical protein